MHIPFPSPVVGVQRYGSGLAELGADEDASLGAVHRGHRDGLVARVGPVQVVLQPIQSQTHRRLKRRVHQGHLLGRVAGLVDEGTAGKGVGLRVGGRRAEGARDYRRKWERGEQGSSGDKGSHYVRNNVQRGNHYRKI